MKSEKEVRNLYEQLCRQYGVLASADLRGHQLHGRKKALRVLAWILEIEPDDVEREVSVER